MGKGKFLTQNRGGELKRQVSLDTTARAGAGCEKDFEKSRDCISEDVAPLEDMSLRWLKNHQVWSILPCMWQLGPFHV